MPRHFNYLKNVVQVVHGGWKEIFKHTYPIYWSAITTNTGDGYQYQQAFVGPWVIKFNPVCRFVLFDVSMFLDHEIASIGEKTSWYEISPLHQLRKLDSFLGTLE